MAFFMQPVTFILTVLFTCYSPLLLIEILFFFLIHLNMHSACHLRAETFTHFYFYADSLKTSFAVGVLQVME